MSSALAIAAVSAVLKDLLDNAMIDRGVSSTVNNTVLVTAQAPDLIKLEANSPPQLNLFLYHVSENQGWRNVDLPSRNGRGSRLTNPPLALDLHYLLTAYASRDFHAEILLGYAMQLLHEVPVLTRAAINQALNPQLAVDDEDDTVADLPDRLQQLVGADLADQIELVKITPEVLTIDEMSKIWSAIQSHYRPTAAYVASVVLIESQAPARSALPVLTRGALDTGPEVSPDLLSPFPTLTGIDIPLKYPAALLGETISIRGHHLDGDDQIVRFTSFRLASPVDVPAPAMTYEGVDLTLPNDPVAFAPGVYSVSALVERPGESYARSTNEVEFHLAPEILLSPPEFAPVVERDGDTVTITLNCRPQVRREQRVWLLLDDIQIAAEPREAAQTATLVFVTDSLAAGEYRMRLRVDGVESRLINRSGDLPVFNPAHVLTVPA